MALTRLTMCADQQLRIEPRAPCTQPKIQPNQTCARGPPGHGNGRGVVFVARVPELNDEAEAGVKEEL
jgi:hypothetical protein